MHAPGHRSRWRERLGRRHGEFAQLAWRLGVSSHDACMQFFNIAVDVPNGSFELLEKVMEGANLEVDESEEERKGGAG